MVQLSPACFSAVSCGSKRSKQEVYNNLELARWGRGHVVARYTVVRTLLVYQRHTLLRQWNRQQVAAGVNVGRQC